MKHPFKFFAFLFFTLAALATAVIMTLRYMDVLQKQFDFLRGQLARRTGKTSEFDDLTEEFSDADEDEDEAEEESDSFPVEEGFDNEELKF